MPSRRRLSGPQHLEGGVCPDCGNLAKSTSDEAWLNDDDASKSRWVCRACYERWEVAPRCAGCARKMPNLLEQFPQTAGDGVLCAVCYQKGLEGEREALTAKRTEASTKGVPLDEYRKVQADQLHLLHEPTWRPLPSMAAPGALFFYDEHGLDGPDLRKVEAPA